MRNKPVNISIDEFSSPIKSFATLEMDYETLDKILTEQGFRHLPVLENNKPVGIITQRDLNVLKNMTEANTLTAREIMTPDPYCVHLGTSIEEAAFAMSERKIGSAIVLNSDGEADSIFTSIDGLNALIEIVRGEIEQ